MRRLSIPEGFLRNGEPFLIVFFGTPTVYGGPVQAAVLRGPTTKSRWRTIEMGAIKKLRDITENDVKEAWSALRERKPLIFHITNNMATPLQAKQRDRKSVV